MGTKADIPLIVSFATTDHYQRWGEKLIDNCNLVGMDHHVDFIDPFSQSKRETCLHRPQYLLDLLDRYDRPLVWFDADGTILKRFEVPDGPCAFVDNPWRHPDNPITAGIFMVRRSAQAMLERWSDLCAQWRPGDFGSHRRLCWVRDEFDYEDMTPMVRGKVVLRGAAGKDERRV